MLNSDNLSQIYVDHILNMTKKLEEELTEEQLPSYQSMLVLATINLTKTRNIASITDLDLNGTKIMNKAIFDARNKYDKIMSDKDVRSYVVTYIKICNKLTKSPTTELPLDVDKLILRKLFFPVALPDNASIENRNKLLSVIGEYKWNI